MNEPRLKNNPTPKELVDYVIKVAQNKPTMAEKLMFMGSVLYVLGAQQKYPNSWG